MGVLPYEHSRSRAYRWDEDGLRGISDERQRLSVSVAFWNGLDPMLKRSPFGLIGNEGNHREDDRTNNGKSADKGNSGSGNGNGNGNGKSE